MAIPPQWQGDPHGGCPPFGGERIFGYIHRIYPYLDLKLVIPGFTNFLEHQFIFSINK